MAREEERLSAREMETITISQIGEIIDWVCIAERQPVMIIGPSGGGKTAGVDQWVTDPGNNAFMCKVLLGQYDSADLKGYPGIRTFDEYRQATWYPAATLPFVGNPLFPKDKLIVLFLDELTSASVAVKAVCYQLIQERRVGEHVLMDNVIIVCAGNRESDKGVVTAMPAPLANRLTWYETVVSVPEWCRWMGRTHGKKAAIFAGYFNWQKDHLHNWDPAKPKKVFCSPRTAEVAFRYYISAMPDQLKKASMAGAIGPAINDNFWGYVNVWADVERMKADIIANPLTAALPVQADMQWAMVMSLSMDLTLKTAPTYHPYMLRMDKDYVLAAWQMATARDEKLYRSPQYVEVAKLTRDVFRR